MGAREARDAGLADQDLALQVTLIDRQPHQRDVCSPIPEAVGLVDPLDAQPADAETGLLPLAGPEKGGGNPDESGDECHGHLAGVGAGGVAGADGDVSGLGEQFLGVVEEGHPGRGQAQWSCIRTGPRWWR
jgi:hypothetical protein